MNLPTQLADLPALNQVTVPDLWQQQAVAALRDGSDVVVQAPTGAGKTLIFELWSNQGKNRGQAIYTVPTRALANDKLAEWRARGWDVGIATGDLTLNPDAKVVVATLETQRARFLRRQGSSYCSAAASTIRRTWSNDCDATDVIQCSLGMISDRCRNMKST